MMGSHMRDASSYLDGIPVKISANFLPPRPVALPLAHDTTFTEDLLEEQYDFTFEKKLLEAIDQKRLELASRSAEKTSKIQKSSPNSSEQDVAQKLSVYAMESSSAQCVVPSWQSDSILQPKPQQFHDKISAPSEPETKINLSDFENDTSSPFDLMELKTINDLEELNNVFQGLGNNTSVVTVTEDSSEGVGNVSKSVSFPLPESSYVSSEKISSSWSENFSANELKDENSNQSSVVNPECLVRKSNNSSTFDSSQLQKRLDALPYRNYDSISPLPELYSYPVLSNYSSADQNIFTQRKGNAVYKNSFPGAVSDFLEDRCSTLSQVPYIPSFKGSNLKTSKSYSDIQRVPDSEMVTEQRERSRTPTNDVYCKYNTDISTEEIPAFVKEADNANSNGVCDNGLPDPYDELGEGEKSLVDSITEMGFPRAQVARAVKHLGADDKKVVEHLCQIQVLEESGYESLEAEAALHLHDYNRDQAKIFLDLVIQFQDLGFEKNAVKKALVQNKNDWNKTIDSLLPQ